MGVDVPETRSRQARVDTSVNKRKKTLTELESGKSGISLDRCPRYVRALSRIYSQLSSVHSARHG